MVLERGITVQDAKELHKVARKRDKKEVLFLLKKNTLEQIDNIEEKQQIITEIVNLRSLDIMKILAKKQTSFYPKMFEMNMSNYMNRDFMNRVLSKYGRKFDLEDVQVKKWMMKTACKVGNKKMVQEVLKSRNGYNYLPYLANTDKHIFDIVKTIVADYVPPEIVIELIIQAAKEKDGEERLRILRKTGYSFEEKDAKGRTVVNLMELKAKDRKEKQNQKLYKDALKHLKTVQWTEKRNKLRKLFIVKLTILFISVGMGYSIWSIVHSDKKNGITMSSDSELTSGDLSDTTSDIESEDTVYID